MKRKLKAVMSTLDELLESEDVTSRGYFQISNHLKEIWVEFENPEPPEPEEEHAAERSDSESDQAPSSDEEDEDDDEYDAEEQFTLILHHELCKVSSELYHKVLAEVLAEEVCEVAVNIERSHPRLLRS